LLVLLELLEKVIVCPEIRTIRFLEISANQRIRDLMKNLPIDQIEMMDLHCKQLTTSNALSLSEFTNCGVVGKIIAIRYEEAMVRFTFNFCGDEEGWEA
jgi:hypothetical protein